MKKRFYKRPVFFVPAIVLAVPALWLAWWLGSPLFIDKTVVEAFPSATTAGPTTAVPEEPSDGVEDSPPETEPVTTGAPDSGAVTTSPPETPVTTASPSTTTAPSAEPTVTTQAEPSGPVALLAGMFKDADSRHRGSGDATIYRLEDGSLVLRVENLDVTNGPDLHVILTPVADAESRDDVHADGYLDLGELKGNKGDQNYPIEGDIDLSKPWTVVIYCVPFHVVFSTAPVA